MTIDELLAACLEGEHVVLKMGLPLSQGDYRKLHRNRGPRGTILCGTPGSHQVVQFNSEAVMKYIEANEEEL